MEHYACMVDLSRAGHLNEARIFIERMLIQAYARVWMCLSSACRVYNHVQLGEHAIQKIKDPKLAMDGHLEAAKVTMTMKEKGLRKMPGCSWIEEKDKINVFLSMDSAHPHNIEVYRTFEDLTRNIHEEGYVPRSGYRSNGSLLLSRGDEGRL
ncbi:Pentatricopeptide repeat-containing protein [Nymphaea thermarum]|nr:Pentatricopeptide repeat-containing protein [Nymphaea thermarum]